MGCVKMIHLKSGDVVPCGKCGLCLRSKRNAWSFRLRQEAKCSSHNYFVTLTYSQQNVPKDDKKQNVLCKADLQKYFKRLRKDVGKIRYYAVGEYGGVTKRPHYHLIVFASREISADISANWSSGYVDIKRLSGGSIHYVTKYVIDKKLTSKSVKPFSVMSLKPAIGSAYLDFAIKYLAPSLRMMVRLDGIPIALPRYYKDRIYTPKQKQLIRESFQEQKYARDHKVIQELRKFHNDPYSYLTERMEAVEKSVKTKIKVKNEEKYFSRRAV
jgi:hypothetical protein